MTSHRITGSAGNLVRIPVKFLMPNAFTPNNDGLNDEFRIPGGVVFTLKEFSVYDGWGNKIFTTADARTGWKEIYKGGFLHAGAYVYVISGSDDKGPVYQKGVVMLLR